MAFLPNWLHDGNSRAFRTNWNGPPCWKNTLFYYFEPGREKKSNFIDLLDEIDVISVHDFVVLQGRETLKCSLSRSSPVSKTLLSWGEMWCDWSEDEKEREPLLSRDCWWHSVDSPTKSEGWRWLPDTKYRKLNVECWPNSENVSYKFPVTTNKKLGIIGLPSNLQRKFLVENLWNTFLPNYRSIVRLNFSHHISHSFWRRCTEKDSQQHIFSGCS